MDFRLLISDWGYAHIAQAVEHVLGKDGVTSSTLVVGSNGEVRDGVIPPLAGLWAPEEAGSSGQGPMISGLSLQPEIWVVGGTDHCSLITAF